MALVGTCIFSHSWPLKVPLDSASVLCSDTHGEFGIERPIRELLGGRKQLHIL